MSRRVFSWVASSALAVTACQRAPAEAPRASALPMTVAVAAEPLAAPAAAAAAAAPAAPATGATAASVRIVVSAAWGDGPGQLGVVRTGEQNPEGPMALDVGPGGEVVVLDQVNSRLQVFASGQPPRAVPLPGRTFQDLALDGRGLVVLLDRVGTGAVVAVALADGQVRWRLPLVGPLVPEAGGVTGVFAHDDGAWVEVEHTRLVHLADLHGTAVVAPRQGKGRRSADGRNWLRAARVDGASAEVVAEPLAGSLGGFRTVLPFATPLRTLRGLDSDRSGRTLLLASLWREDPANPDRVLDERLQAVLLGPGGAEVARLDLAPATGPEEQFRTVRLGPDGAVYHLRCGPDGATVVQVKP